MKRFIYIIFGVVTLLLAVPAVAHAFIGTAIAAVVGAIATSAGITLAATTLGYIATGARIAATIGSFLYSRSLTPDLPEVGRDSATYDDEFPRATVQSGTPVPRAYGRTLMAGNIIRQNDAKESGNIDFIVAHCMGEIDAYLGYTVNGVEWTDFRNVVHAKYSHTGASNQGAVTNLFSDAQASNYRGYAVTELRLNKGDEVKEIQNVNVVGRWKKCLDIGQDAGGTTSWTRNPAQIMWDWYITEEEYSASGLDQNSFTALETYCATVPSDASCPVRPTPVSDDTVVEAARLGNWQYKAKYGLRKNKSVTGGDAKNSWKEGGTTNKRINIDMGVPVAVDKFVLENHHISGAETAIGIQNFVIQGSNNGASFSDTTYVSTGWTDLLTAAAGQHSANDVSEPEEFTVVNSTAYRYYAIKMADNYGDGGEMGFRDALFFAKQPRYIFDFAFDGKIEKNDAKKLIWQSYNGQCVMSQGVIKPVWDAAQEHDGAGGLQTKAVQFSFTEDNIVADSLEWGRVKKPNLIRIYYIDSADAFKKNSVEMRDDRDIAARGEIISEETCWWITETQVAKRRAKYKFDKARYTDFVYVLTGWPSSQVLEVYDRVQVTHSKPGCTEKDFIIIEKDEDQYGRPKFYLEEYLSGVYSDDGFQLQPGYRAELPNPNEPTPPSTSIGLASITTGTKYTYGSVKVTFTPPNYPHYSYTEIYASKDDATYYFVGKSDGSKDFVIQGMGMLYEPGDTVYIRLRNINVNGVGEPFPTSADASIVAVTTIKIASWVADDNYFYGLASGTPISSPSDGIVLKSGSQGGVIVYEATAKRVEMGYLSAGVYGLKGYATDGATVIFELSDTQQKIAGWNFDDAYLWGLASGTPTSSPNDGVVLKAGSTGGLTVYEDTAKRVEVGYLSAGVYGIKAYDSGGSNVMLELSDTQQIISGWEITQNYIRKMHDGNSGIWLDSSYSAIIVADDYEGVPINFLRIGSLTNELHPAFGISIWNSAGDVVFQVDDGGTAQIAGWNFDNVKLTCQSGEVGMNAEATGGVDWRFWAGHATPASAPFRVDESGNLYATSATITGAITATSGSIGSFTIGTYLYTGSKTAYNDANAGVHLGSDGLGIGNNIFTVSAAGALVATSATITGAITATSGAIGGWNIAATTLTSANITLDSANDKITVNTLTIDGANNRIRSANYVSGLVLGAGFTLEPDLLEVGNIKARGMIQTAVFQKDTISVVGGNVFIRPADVLATTMTAADSQHLVTQNNETFAVGDFLRIKGGTVGGVADEWFEVTVDNLNGDYTVTRDKAGSYAPDANPAWTKGASVVNYGASGKGGIYFTSSETNAPYIEMFTHAGAPWTTISRRMRVGNLNGTHGYVAETYGMVIGDYAASKTWIGVDDTNGIRVMNNTTQVGQWDTSGNILVGQTGAGQSNVYITSGAVNLRTNTTNFLTLDTSGVIYIGNSDNEYVKVSSSGVQIYDGATLLATYAASTTFYDTNGADRLVLGVAGITIGDVTEGTYGTIGTTSLLFRVDAGAGVYAGVFDIDETTARFGTLKSGSIDTEIYFSAENIYLRASGATQVQITTATTAVANDLTLQNGNCIGISASDERLEFYTAGYAAFMGCSVGIGTVVPKGDLQIGDASVFQDINTGATAFLSYGRNVYYDGANYLRSVADNPSLLIQLDASGDYHLYTQTDAGATAGSTITFVDRFTVLNNGNVGIGVTPTEKFHVATDSSSGYAAYFFNDGNNADRFGIKIQCGPDDTSSDVAYFTDCYDGDGTEVGGTRDITGTFGVFQGSDEGMKKDIFDTTKDSASLLKQLRVVDFKWKHNNGNGHGFIAQELMEVFPEMVAPMPSGKLATNPMNLIPHLVYACQQEYNKIEALNLKIKQLELEIEAMK